MPRRYYRRARYSRPKKKYSWEHANFSNTNGAVAANNSWTGKAVLVSEAGIGGMRKAKNFTLSINVEWDQIMFFALVYVPEGTHPLCQPVERSGVCDACRFETARRARQSESNRRIPMRAHELEEHGGHGYL